MYSCASLTVTLCIVDTRAPVTDSRRADKSCWSVSHACNREVRLECINMQVDSNNIVLGLTLTSPFVLCTLTFDVTGHQSLHNNKLFYSLLCKVCVSRDFT